MVFEIRDAVYGDIVLQDDEAQLIDTYELQRLRHIKQLGYVSQVYPSADHSRYNHSLGSRWIAQKIVRISDLPIKKSDRKILYKAALLHDVAEPAFAHATERLSKKGMRNHEEVVEFVLNGTYKDKVLENYDGDAKFVCDVITSEKERDEIKALLLTDSTKTEKPFLRELIHGYIDADILDYLYRDAFFLGLDYATFDDRIFASFRIVDYDDGKEHIAFRNSDDTLNAIISVLDSRFTLRKAAYLHHAVTIADEMFLEALQLALSDKSVNMFDIFTCGDYELLYKIRQSQEARPLIDSILTRNLFKRVFVLTNDTPYPIKNRIRKLENEPSGIQEFKYEIKEKTGVSTDRILLHFSPPVGWKDFDRILLVSDNDGKIVTLQNKLPGYLALLKNKYESLWHFMVSTNVKEKKVKDNLFKACAEWFEFSGVFKPKKTFDDFEKLKRAYYSSVEELQKEEPSSIHVLKTLISAGKQLSRDDIAKTLQIKPATVSHYLTLINKKMSETSVEILKSKRIGRKKVWVINEKLKDVWDDIEL